MQRFARTLLVVLTLGLTGCGGGEQPAKPTASAMTFEAWQAELPNLVKPGMTAADLHPKLGERWLDKSLERMGKSGAFLTMYVLQGQTLLRLSCTPEGRIAAYGLARIEPNRKKIDKRDVRRLSRNDAQGIVVSNESPPLTTSQWHYLIARLASSRVTELDVEGQVTGAYLDKSATPLDDSVDGPYRVVYLLHGGVVLDCRYNADASLAEFLVGPAIDAKQTKLGKYEDWRAFMQPDRKRPVVSYPPLAR